MTELERQELKTFAWAAPLVLPMIERRKANALARLMVDFKAGKTDNLTIVAELNVLNDLEREIIQKQQEFQQMESRNVRTT
jgi:hypothetical protein